MKQRDMKQRGIVATSLGATALVLALSVSAALPQSPAGAAPLAAARERHRPHLRQISTDPFTNPDSQHATEVEPDTFAHGRTVVAAFQTGRFFDGGSSDIGFSVSHNGGRTWPVTGFLPFLTPHSHPAGPYDRASDPAVAYDAAHHAWLISSLTFTTTTSALAISRSTDGGRHWSRPSIIAAGTGQDFDKNWIVCDNHRASPFFGHCYSTWDDNGHVDLLLSSTSVDSGRTWSAPVPTPDHAIGIGGQPVVQPNGTVIVPTSDLLETHLLSYRSTDGGATWSTIRLVSDTPSHLVAGNLRTSPLPSAEIDGSGSVYVSWQDCRFRSACSANDIVISHSRDGLTWTAPRRVPIDAVSSRVDHFIPGLGVDPSSHGRKARLGLSYYFYPDANCTATSCRLEVGFISSGDAGATWSRPKTLTRTPMPLAWVASTSQGSMVGDYMSTSFSGSNAVSVFAFATPKTLRFHESMFAAVNHVSSHAGERSAMVDQPQAGAATVGPAITARPTTRR